MRIFVSGFLAMSAVLWAGDGADSKDIEKLQGNWTVYEFNGERVEVPRTLFVDKGVYCTKDNKDQIVDTGRIILRGDKTPKEYDIIRPDEKGVFQTYKGIYKFEGENWVACIYSLDRAIKERPKSFDDREKNVIRFKKVQGK